MQELSGLDLFTLYGHFPYRSIPEFPNESIKRELLVNKIASPSLSHLRHIDDANVGLKHFTQRHDSVLQWETVEILRGEVTRQITLDPVAKCSLLLQGLGLG